MVPTLTFLYVLWVRGCNPAPQVAQQIVVPGETENENEDNRRRKNKNLVHWARMAPIIEGGIEAPLQLILQVSKDVELKSGLF